LRDDGHPLLKYPDEIDKFVRTWISPKVTFRNGAAIHISPSQGRIMNIDNPPCEEFSATLGVTFPI
jgi:hypothetical protein